MKKLEGNLTERDVLEFAMELESEAGRYYSAAAGMVTDPKAHGLLLGLAEEELDHERKFRNLADSIENGTPLPEQFPVTQTQESCNKIQNSKLGAGSSIHDVISVAIEREKELIHIYQTFSHFLSAGAFRDLCGFLVREEQNHLYELEELYHQEKKISGSGGRFKSPGAATSGLR